MDGPDRLRGGAGKGLRRDEFHESVHEARILQAILEGGLPKPRTGVRVVTRDESLGEAEWKDGGVREGEFVATLASAIATRTRQFAGRSLEADGIELEASAGRAQYEPDSQRARAIAASIG